MNNLRKKVIAAPYPQKLNRLFSEDKISIINRTCRFYLQKGDSQPRHRKRNNIGIGN